VGTLLRSGVSWTFRGWERPNECLMGGELKFGVEHPKK
jgi:hypothetical protein